MPKSGSHSVAVALLALRRARDHIDRNHRDPLDPDGLAAVASASKYHFARCFEATYGETPIRDLTRRRIERAQGLLRAANLTVTEVCIAGRGLPLGHGRARRTSPNSRTSGSPAIR